MATRGGDLTGQARAHHGLGRACALLGSMPEAQAHLSRALQLYEQLGDVLAEARTHIDMGTALAGHGQFHEALGHAERARDLFQAARNRTGVGGVLPATARPAWFGRPRRGHYALGRRARDQ